MLNPNTCDKFANDLKAELEMLVVSGIAKPSLPAPPPVVEQQQ